MNTVDRAKAILRSGGTVVIEEPCDCGDNIRHNNGGNYHQVIRLKIRLGKVWAQFGSTCELLPAPEWEPAGEDVINQHSAWL